jgi:orotidine-5'-phosphate decarboxylase
VSTELIIVLDIDSREAALETVRACGDCLYYKVGAQLFTRCGPAIVKELQDMGKKVFLDLKYHDIPNTVARAAKAAADLGSALMTVHASGGRRMIEAAREAVEGSETRILAVTVLTSLSDEMLRDELGVPGTVVQTVRRWAQLAVDSGAHGVVCSPRELKVLRETLGPDALIVTPGIRPAWASQDDQVRVMSPAEAAQAGASFIVVGRPILRHEDPAEAVRRIMEELAQ